MRAQYKNPFLIIARIFATVVVAIVLLFPAGTHARSLEELWGVIDGTQTSPTLSEGNVAPTLVRTGTGAYTLSFSYPVRWFLAQAQTRGVLGNAPDTIVTTRKDTQDARTVYLSVFLISRWTDAAGLSHTGLEASDAVVSFAVRLYGLVGDVGARIRSSQSTPVPHEQAKVLEFDQEVFDTNDLHDSAQPGRLTIRSAGKYLIYGSVSFSAGPPDPDSSGYRDLHILHNGGPIATQRIPVYISINTTEIAVSTVSELALGDYVELQVGQHNATGSTLDIQVTGQSPIFGAIKLGPSTPVQSTPTCGGVSLHGACWFLGLVDQGCDDRCAANSLLYDDLTRTIVGSDGAEDKCDGVLRALGVTTGGVQTTSGCPSGLGCTEATVGPPSRVRCITPATDARSASPGHRRVCACK